MARRRKPKRDRHVTIHMTIPPRLAARIDKMLKALRAEEPYRSVTRSALIGYLVGEHIALIDDIDKVPTSKAEVRKRMRRSNLKDSHVGVNGNAVLAPRQVLKIRSDKRPNRFIAAEMGVHDSTIARVKSGQTWAWVG